MFFGNTNEDTNIRMGTNILMNTNTNGYGVCRRIRCHSYIRTICILVCSFVYKKSHRIKLRWCSFVLNHYSAFSAGFCFGIGIALIFLPLFFPVASSFRISSEEGISRGKFSTTSSISP